MSSEKSKWWKTPPYSNIVGGLAVLAIAGTLRLAYEWIIAPDTLLNLKGFWDLIISSFSFILNYNVKFWWLLIIVSIFPLIRFIYKKGIKKSPMPVVYDDPSIYTSDEEYDKLHVQMDKDEAKKQRILEYIAERFDEYIWRWDWIYNDLIKRHEIKRIRPCCPVPECNNYDLKRAYKDSDKLYKCWNCDKNYYIDISPNEIEKKIDVELAIKESANYF